MKEKKYILMTIEKSNYDDYSRYYYRLFNTYRELQHHLLKFRNTPSYLIFKETTQKKDKSFRIDKNFKGGNFYE